MTGQDNGCASDLLNIYRKCLYNFSNIWWIILYVAILKKLCFFVVFLQTDDVFLHDLEI